MAQIKYVVFACLMFLAGFIAINFFQKISSSQLIRESNEEIFSPEQDTTSLSGDVSKGQKLFRENCASCHAIDKVLSAPALKNVMERGPWAEDKENFKKWVRNPIAFIPTTSYTIDLQKQYGSIMPAFNMSEEQLEWIYQYLKAPPASYSKKIASR